MKISKIFMTLTLFSILIPYAHADVKNIFYQRYLDSQKSENKSNPAKTLPKFFDQKLDPSNPDDSRTFKQRYYVNSSFAKGTKAPVLFYICGESSCDSSSIEYGSIVGLAKKLGAHRVALEHRYYGGSNPFPKMDAESLKYLKTENAIEDLANFQRFAMKTFKMAGKWIAIGGSYPGMLSAFYHQKYPELTVGALASSAPVRAKANFEEYDQTVFEAVGERCAAKMRETVKKLESSLDNPEQLATYKKMFDAQKISDPVDFLAVVADMAAFAVQYGYTSSFCQTLLGDSDSVRGYASAGTGIFRRFGISAFEDSVQFLDTESPSDMRAWIYQSCTEYGFFQVGHHDPAISVRSSLINLDFYEKTCKKLYGVDLVDAEKTNEKFYLPLFSQETQNILFTNGSLDPWAKLSISQELGNNTNPGLSTYTIDGGSHCQDLSSKGFSDSDSLIGARTLFEELAQGWLSKKSFLPSTR